MPPFKEFFSKKCVLIVLVVGIVCASVIGIAYILKPQPAEETPTAKPLQAPMIQLNETEILKCFEKVGFKKSTKHNYYSHVATCRDLAQLTNSLLERGKELPEWSKVDERKEVLIDDYEWKDRALLLHKITAASENLCQGCPGSGKKLIVASTVKAPAQPALEVEPKTTTTTTKSTPSTSTTVPDTTSTTTASSKPIVTIAKIATPSAVPAKTTTKSTSTTVPETTSTTTASSKTTVSTTKITTSSPVPTKPPAKPRTKREIDRKITEMGYRPVLDKLHYAHNSTCRDLSELFNWLTQEEKDIPLLARFTWPKEVVISEAQTTDTPLLIKKIRNVRDIVCQNSSDILTRLSKYEFETRGEHLYEARLSCANFSELWNDSYASNDISFSPHIRNETWIVLHELELSNRSQLIETLEWVSGTMCQPLPSDIWRHLEEENVRLLSEGVVDSVHSNCDQLKKLLGIIDKKPSQKLPAYVQMTSVKLMQKLNSTHAKNCKPDLDETNVSEILKASNFTQSEGGRRYSHDASCREIATVLNKLKKEYGELPEWSEVLQNRIIVIDHYELPLVIEELERESLSACQNGTTFWKRLTDDFESAGNDTYEADISCEKFAKWLQVGDGTSGDLPDWSKANNATRVSILKMETSNKTRLMRKLRSMSHELCKLAVMPVDIREALKNASFTSYDNITYVNNDASCATVGQLRMVLGNNDMSLPEWSKRNKSHPMELEKRVWGQQDLLIEHIEAFAKSVCTEELNFWEKLVKRGFTDRGAFFNASLTCSEFNELFKDVNETWMENGENLDTTELHHAVLYRSQWIDETKARGQLKSIANDFCRPLEQLTSDNSTQTNDDRQKIVPLQHQQR